MHRDKHPIPHIDDALELARLLRSHWAEFDTGPLVCEGDDGDDKSLLDQLRDKRKSLIDEAGALVDKRTAEREDFEARAASDKDDEKPSDEERSAFTGAEEAFNEDFLSRKNEIDTLTQRIDEQELIERRREEAARVSGREVRVSSEPRTYRADNAHEISYYRDLALSSPNIAQSLNGSPDEARERLANHGKDVGDWVKRQTQSRERRAQEQIDQAERDFHKSRGAHARGFDESPFEQRVTPNRTDGQGGYLVPPLWLVEDYIPALRAGRVAADLTRNLPLPEGTDSINIPKISTTTLVAPQQQDGGAVASQDFTDTVVTANVKTLAGQADITLQLLEQSPGQIVDRVVTEDLMADYNRLVDRQVISGNGTNSAALNGGQILGLYPSANWGANVVTWTSSGPLGNSFNQVMGAMASQTAYNRFDLSNFNFLLHPRRWFWFATSLDGASGTAGRPLVNPRDTGHNVSAINQSDVPEQGLAGSSLFGPDVYIDGNVPTTDALGVPAAGTADVAIGAKWDDLWLFEGDLRTRVLPEVLSGTLEVRFQTYNYVAFLVRYGPSVTIAKGTGFAAPTGAIDTSIVF